jgi:hypothetical protein
MRASPLIFISCCLWLLLFFGSVVAAGAGAGAAGVAAAGAAAAFALKGAETPPFTMATGWILPSLPMRKIVISASLRSPLASNSTLPVAPVKEMLNISGVNLAGSVELAFFIASMIASVPS